MMKKLLFFLCLLTATSAFCQNSELFGHTWHAKSITINNITTEAPKNPNMEIQATFDETSSFTDMCCAGTLNFSIDYQSQTTFGITDFSPFLETCNENDNNEFRGLYISFFQEGLADNFEYEIIEDYNNWYYKILTLTNIDGDTLQLYNSPHNTDADGYIFEDGLGYWYLQDLTNEGTFYTLPYNIAKETEISFNTDGSFKSIICGEINSKVVFNGDYNEGDFYISCESLTLTSGNCGNQDSMDVEQDFYAILEDLATSDDFTFQRWFSEFGDDPCDYANVLEIYNPSRDIGFTLIDCVEHLSLENYSKKMFSIYPNPVKNKLIIENSSLKSSQLNLSIYTIQGKEVVSKNIQFENETSIDVSNLSSGMYFINIEDERGIKTTQKIVKF
ncbi:T9SS type A sorting domain-containing protein [Marixanthomonas ophiurae]|nr:T9SS type A sorting domain-containing protein [Marixanthomonas ophiurae]